MAQKSTPGRCEKIFGMDNEGHHVDPTDLPLDLRLRRAEARRQQREREKALATMSSLDVTSRQMVNSLQSPWKLSSHEELILERGTRTPWEAPENEVTLQESKSAKRHRLKPLPIQPFENVTPMPHALDRLHGTRISDSTEASVVPAKHLVKMGMHRDGYSEGKCRLVLIKHCAWVPRQFNYVEGLKRVYPILREFLGDENLDLATGVLYEMIEIPISYGWEEGGVFQRWKFDHMRRSKNLENDHLPGLGNIVVGSIIPTDGLRHYRQHMFGPEVASSSSSTSTAQAAKVGYQSMPNLDESTSVTNIKSQKPWQIDHSFFVSSLSQGTRVHKKPPSAADLHKMVWDSSFGLTGKMIEERQIQPSKVVPRYPRDSRVISQHFHPKFLVDIKGASPRGSNIKHPLMDLKVFLSSRNISTFDAHTASDETNSYPNPPSTKPEQRCNMPIGYASLSAKAYEMDEAVQSLPDPNSEGGHKYFSKIRNQRLPEGFIVPTEAFAVKNDLAPESTISSNAALVRKRIHVADDLALYNSVRASLEAISHGQLFKYNGPFTNELFKDSGLDFKWNPSQDPEMKAFSSFSNGQSQDRSNLPLDVSSSGFDQTWRTTKSNPKDLADLCFLVDGSYDLAEQCLPELEQSLNSRSLRTTMALRVGCMETYEDRSLISIAGLISRIPVPIILSNLRSGPRDLIFLECFHNTSAKLYSSAEVKIKNCQKRYKGNREFLAGALVSISGLRDGRRSDELRVRDSTHSIVLSYSTNTSKTSSACTKPDFLSLRRPHKQLYSFFHKHRLFHLCGLLCFCFTRNTFSYRKSHRFELKHLAKMEEDLYSASSEGQPSISNQGLPYDHPKPGQPGFAVWVCTPIIYNRGEQPDTVYERLRESEYERQRFWICLSSSMKAKLAEAQEAGDLQGFEAKYNSQVGTGEGEEPHTPKATRATENWYDAGLYDPEDEGSRSMTKRLRSASFAREQRARALETSPGYTLPATTYESPTPRERTFNCQSGGKHREIFVPKTADSINTFDNFKSLGDQMKSKLEPLSGFHHRKSDEYPPQSSGATPEIRHKPQSSGILSERKIDDTQDGKAARLVPHSAPNILNEHQHKRQRSTSSPSNELNDAREHIEEVVTGARPKSYSQNQLQSEAMMSGGLTAPFPAPMGFSNHIDQDQQAKEGQKRGISKLFKKLRVKLTGPLRTFLARRSEKSIIDKCAGYDVSMTQGQIYRLYEKLEMIISSAANTFLLEELFAGRLTAQDILSIKDVSVRKKLLHAKDFKVNQTAQLQLIHEKGERLRFRGTKTDDQILRILKQWKDEAYMAEKVLIKVFGVPDRIIGIHLDNSYGILEILGASKESFVVLAGFRTGFNKFRDEPKEAANFHESPDAGTPQERRLPSKTTNMLRSQSLYGLKRNMTSTDGQLLAMPLPPLPPVPAHLKDHVFCPGREGNCPLPGQGITTLGSASFRESQLEEDVRLSELRRQHMNFRRSTTTSMLY